MHSSNRARFIQVYELKMIVVILYHKIEQLVKYEGEKLKKFNKS